MYIKLRDDIASICVGIAMKEIVPILIREKQLKQIKIICYTKKHKKRLL